jgi:ribosomal protein S18 acetylase RimI-like enzyme
MSVIRPFHSGDLTRLYLLLKGIASRDGAIALGSYRLAMSSIESFEREMQSRDYPPEGRMLVCMDNNGLTAAIGFDRDRGDSIADIEGPFIGDSSSCSESELFDRLLELIARKKSIKEIRSVILSGQSNLRQFLKRHDFEEFRERSLSMQLRRKDWKPADVDPDLRIEFGLTESNRDVVISLLNATRDGFCRTIQELDFWLESGDFGLYTILKGSSVVAVGAYRGRGDAVHLLQLTVSEPFRGKGLGHQCLTLMMDDFLKDHQPERFTLSVSTRNDRAVKLYRKAGFQTDQEILFMKRPLALARSEQKPLSHISEEACRKDSVRGE